MKKILLFLSLALCSICYGQGPYVVPGQPTVATSSLQTIGNNTLTVIKKKLDTLNQYQRSVTSTLTNTYNKYDTTTKVFIKSFDPTVTYSAASVAMLGNTTVQSWSINLGSQYWVLVDAKVCDLGNNFAMSSNMLILNDTINLTDNVAPTYTSARARKIIGNIANLGNMTLPWTAGRVNTYGSSVVGTMGVFTGVIYFAHFASGVQGLSGQRIITRLLFRKVKD